MTEKVVTDEPRTVSLSRRLCARGLAIRLAPDGRTHMLTRRYLKNLSCRAQCGRKGALWLATTEQSFSCVKCAKAWKTMEARV
jgi:hypothetical protein